MPRIMKSERKGKQLMAVFPGGRRVHFGDSSMPEYPGTKRGDNYCARSYGITDGQGQPTRNNPQSPNYLSRKYLWNCEGKKSKRR